MGRYSFLLLASCMSWMFSGCGGFPDVRGPNANQPVTENPVKDYSGYWISTSQTELPFTESRDGRKLTYVFVESRKTNILSIQTSGEVLLYGAHQTSDRDFEVVEDLLGHFFLNKEKAEIEIETKHLKSDSKSKQFILSLASDKKTMKIQMDGLIHAFEQADPSRILKLVKRPLF